MCIAERLATKTVSATYQLLLCTVICSPFLTHKNQTTFVWKWSLSEIVAFQCDDHFQVSMSAIRVQLFHLPLFF